MSNEETVCRLLRLVVETLNHAEEYAHLGGYHAIKLSPLTIKIEDLILDFETRDPRAPKNALHAVDENYEPQYVEVQQSRKRAAAGRKGGSASTPAKRAAAQANGKRGGRPKRPKT